MSDLRDSLPKCPECDGRGWWHDKRHLAHDCEACHTTGYAAFSQLAAANERIAKLEEVTRAFLYHFTDGNTFCPLCLYRIDSKFHTSTCPVVAARELLDRP